MQIAVVTGDSFEFVYAVTHNDSVLLPRKLAAPLPHGHENQIFHVDVQEASFEGSR